MQDNEVEGNITGVVMRCLNVGWLLNLGWLLNVMMRCPDVGWLLNVMMRCLDEG